MEVVLQLAALVAVIVGFAQFLKKLIGDSYTDQRACSKEITRLERDIIQITGAAARTDRRARYYKKLFENENEFNNRLLNALTLDDTTAMLIDIDRQKGQTNERKSNKD